VFFGPAPTYDTGPLRNSIGRDGVTNDALYTNATVAINPDTGKLVWFYQHVPNDQWDFDWAFERQIVPLRGANGQPKKLVVTSGKPGIYDAVEADTGKYVFSVDMGLQNFITSIDPVTGAKTIDPKLIPGTGCRGGRRLRRTAGRFVPATHAGNSLARRPQFGHLGV